MIFDDEIKFILGQQIFRTAPIAHFLRDKKGYEIERKIEVEQTTVFQWMIELYEKHGKEWCRVADDILMSEDK